MIKGNEKIKTADKHSQVTQIKNEWMIRLCMYIFAVWGSNLLFGRGSQSK